MPQEAAIRHRRAGPACESVAPSVSLPVVFQVASDVATKAKQRVTWQAAVSCYDKPDVVRPMTKGFGTVAGKRRGLNLVGRRFHRLKVLRLAPISEWHIDTRGHPTRSWIVQCRCGTVMPRAIPTVDLRHKRRKSCGCSKGNGGPVLKAERTCSVCQELYMGIRASRYCSPECKAKAHRDRIRKERWPARECTCPVCQVSFLAVSSRRLYCSDGCMELAQRQRTAEANSFLRLAATATALGSFQEVS